MKKIKKIKLYKVGNIPVSTREYLKAREVFEAFNSLIEAVEAQQKEIEAMNKRFIGLEDHVIDKSVNEPDELREKIKKIIWDIDIYAKEKDIQEIANKILELVKGKV